MKMAAKRHFSCATGEVRPSASATQAQRKRKWDEGTAQAQRKRKSQVGASASASEKKPLARVLAQVWRLARARQPYFVLIIFIYYLFF